MVRHEDVGVHSVDPLKRPLGRPAAELGGSDHATRVFRLDPRTSVDRSLRAYIHTVSSGLADLHVVVQLPQSIVGTGAGGTDVPPHALEATQGNALRAQGFDGAAIVMLGGPGGGSTEGYWSRFCMSDNRGAWVGEIVHQTNLCNLPDLFDFTDEYPNENMGAYDQEAGYGYTHFSARRSGPSDGSILRPLRYRLDARAAIRFIP